MIMRAKGSAAKARPPLEQTSFIGQLLHVNAISAILLMVSAAVAMIWANSPFFESYYDLWHADFGLELSHLLDFDDAAVRHSLHRWINDGLMCVFFFVVGLEIKRELIVGELASFRRAMLPVAAAIGGMICPALIYALINRDSDAIAGWGIPMATDIAFAAGCLGLLGKRIPRALSVFLVALAIVDDLGSVAVIAIFYTEQIEFPPLIIGTLLITISYVIGKLGVRRSTPYALIGIFLWLAFLESGAVAADGV